MIIMNKKILLPNGTIAIEAEYKSQLIEEFKDNPFIEVLPDLMTKEDIINELSYKVKMNKEEIEYIKELKVSILSRIYKVFQPLPIHIDIWNMIHSLIRQGYIARNPFNPIYKKYLNSIGSKINKKYYNLDANETFRTTTQCGTLIGVSGMGKTTTVQRVLSKIPQVIVHKEYKGINFTQIQVTWLKLEAPANGSIKALTLQFFDKLDNLLGTNNMERYVSKYLSVDAMIPILGQLSNNIGLGLLVIDELQHLDKKAKEVMNYLVTLMNSFGVPILLIGTPASYGMLQQEMRIARRVSGNGAIVFNQMKNDKEFEIFLKGIWKYQWIRKKVKLTKEMIDIFYDKTQGVSDLVVKLFVNIQKRAIESGREEITIELIDKVWDREFKLVNPMVEAIKSNNIAKKMKFEDIQEIEVSKLINKENKIVKDKEEKSKAHDNSFQAKSKEENTVKKIKVSDLSNDDIRKIVLFGKKKNKTVYESLKEKEIVKSIDEVMEEI